MMVKNQLGASYNGSRLIGDPPKRRVHLGGMWYVYVLQSRNGSLYMGMTADLRRRFAEHNSGIGGKYTARNRPFKLLFYEAFCDKKDAVDAEKFFKSGYGREVLKGKIKYCLLQK